MSAAPPWATWVAIGSEYDGEMESDVVAHKRNPTHLHCQTEADAEVIAVLWRGVDDARVRRLELQLVILRGAGRTGHKYMSF